jgi:hypothetical protein
MLLANDKSCRAMNKETAQLRVKLGFSFSHSATKAPIYAENWFITEVGAIDVCCF